jgi:hypothetical protein
MERRTEDAALGYEFRRQVNQIWSKHSVICFIHEYEFALII